MEADERFKNAVGLAMKAGKCISGDFAVEKAAKGGKVRLVLLDETASAATQERYERICARSAVPLLRIAALARAIGKPSRMIAAVTDENMTKMILLAAGSQDKNGGNA